MADIVILGASVPGLAAAIWLAEAGVDVALIDRRTDLATLPFARGPGVLHGGLCEHPWRLVSSLGAVQATRLHQFGIEGITLLSTLAPVARVGTVWCATESDREPGEIVRSRDALHAMALPAESWTGPQADAATGGTGFHAALWRPDEGACDPGAVILALTERAIAAGVALHLGAQVSEVRGHAGAFLVETEHGAHAAEIVIYAGEADAVGLDPFFDTCLTPVREQAIALTSATRLSVGVRAAFGWTQAWTSAQGELCLSGCRWASPPLEEGETDDTQTTAPVQKMLASTAARYFPVAGPIVSRWSWIQATTCDGMPLVGPLPGDPRRVALVGFSGCEGGLGVRAARAVVDGILHGSAHGVPEGFAPARLIA